MALVVLLVLSAMYDLIKEGMASLSGLSIYCWQAVWLRTPLSKMSHESTG